MLSRMFDIPRALAALALLGVAASPTFADGSMRTSCVGGAGSVNCTTMWRSGLGGSAASRLWTPAAEREAAEAADRERLWTERCRPTLHYDDYGVGRYRYAAPGCEYGRYQ